MLDSYLRSDASTSRHSTGSFPWRLGTVTEGCMKEHGRNQPRMSLIVFCSFFFMWLELEVGP